MGLDNIPHNYPCIKQGTAVTMSIPRDPNDPSAGVLTDDSGEPLKRVLCDETQEAGGCPWRNAHPPMEGRVLGIFSTDCWYRGKWGNSLVSRYGDDTDEDLTFYGDNEEGTHKSPESCHYVAEQIDNIVADMDDGHGDWFEPDHRADLIYAAWWLRWVADHADGSDCWY